MLDCHDCHQLNMTQISFTGHVYNVERRDRPGETLDPEAMLSRYEEGTEFYIARQNSRRARGSEPKVNKP